MPSEPGKLDVEVGRALKTDLPERSTEIDVEVIGVGSDYTARQRGKSPVVQSLPRTDGEYLILVDVVSGIKGGQSGEKPGTFRNVCPTMHVSIGGQALLGVYTENWPTVT